LISDLNDLVPIGEDGVGVGNLDNAQRYGAEINTTLNLDGLGLTGVQLEIEAEARETSVEDPFTGLDRRISGNLVSFVFAEARWDIPKTDFAVSLGYDQFRGARRARRDELLFGRGTPGFGFLFIEHKDLFGATGFFELGNLFNQQDRFTRDVFEPDRTGPLVLTEDRKRDFGLIYTVGISGSF
ncbi:MAG: hypothetical protein AAFQ67_05350, partial [Pseudomonadota bacterium]